MVAEGTIKIILDPDTRKLDQALKGKKLGLGADARKGGGAGGELKIKGFGKLLGFAGIAAAILSGLDTFLKPLFNLLKIILTILFLPLIPILKPVLKGLGEMARRLIPIMLKMSDKIEKVLSPRIEKLIDLIVDAVIKNIDSFVNLFLAFLKVFEVFIPLTDVILNAIIKILDFFAKNGERVINFIIDVLETVGGFLFDTWDTIKEILDWIGEFLEPVWKIIKDALEEAGRFLEERWDDILNILERTANLLESVFNKIRDIRDSLSIRRIARRAIVTALPLVQSGGVITKTGAAVVHKGETVIPAGGNQRISIIINNPVVRDEQDIRKLADQISRVMAKGKLRGFAPSF